MISFGLYTFLSYALGLNGLGSTYQFVYAQPVLAETREVDVTRMGVCEVVWGCSRLLALFLDLLSGDDQTLTALLTKEEHRQTIITNVDCNRR